MVSRYPSFAEDFVNLRDMVDRFFAESSPARTAWATSTGAPRMPLPLDVYATNDEVVVIASVPGLQPDDVEITINQNTVSLTGKIANAAQSEDAKDATWYLHEVPFGSFQRSITLPIEVDSARADATFEHGILRLRLPKAEAAKPKQIKVRVAGGNGQQAAIEPGTGE